MSNAESEYATFFRLLRQIHHRGGLSVHGGPVTTVAEDAPKAIAFLRKHAAEIVEGH